MRVDSLVHSWEDGACSTGQSSYAEWRRIKREDSGYRGKARNDKSRDLKLITVQRWLGLRVSLRDVITY